MDPGLSAEPRRILVVDDDPISLAIAAVLLESDGWTVLQADGGAQALDLLASSVPPHCILTDLLMPGLAGPALAERLRRAAPAARILAMSATPPPAVEGFDAVLKKPLSPDTLRDALRDALALDPPPSPSAESFDESAVLDLAIFDRLRRAMSRPGLEEVLTAFFQDAAARLRSMRTADPATLRREAHTLKGGASMIGATRVALAAAALERGIDSEGDRLQILDEIEIHCRRAEGILMQRLK